MVSGLCSALTSVRSWPQETSWHAIDHEMKRIGADCVYLDISASADFIHGHFPNIAGNNSLGIDITKDAIPVVSPRIIPAVA